VFVHTNTEGKKTTVQTFNTLNCNTHKIWIRCTYWRRQTNRTQVL